MRKELFTGWERSTAIIMKYLVNSCEMKQYDINTTEIFKIPPMVLMERAAVSVVKELEKWLSLKNSHILIVCGTGNNGGDGLAIGRILKLAGVKTDIVLAGSRERASEQNKRQQEILNAYQFEVLEGIPEEMRYTAVVDAVFGVGLARPVEGGFRQLIQEMNQIEAYKVAIDIPSGVSADNGGILGTAFRADLTITFAYEKVGLYLWPGNEMTGRIITKKIGIDDRSFLGKAPAVAALETRDLKLLPKRLSHSNKGTFGKLLVIAGSINMAGAAFFAAESAYTVGTGLVRIFTPEENRTVLQAKVPEAVLTTYRLKKPAMPGKTDSPENPSAEKLLESLSDAMDWADVILCGPGVGRTEEAARIVKHVLHNAAVPTVFDADALNLIAQDIGQLSARQMETVITPHLGEMSRLTGKTVSDIQTRLLEEAEQFAKQYGVVCVLKDEHTIISVPYGQTYVNLSGNQGMATAGSGDVLAGMTAGLMAQGMRAEEAAPLAVFLHGCAGDAMIEETGMAGLMASDLVQGIKKVFSDVL